MIFKENVVCYKNEGVNLTEINYTNTITEEETNHLKSYMFDKKMLEIEIPYGTAFFIKENDRVVGFIAYTLYSDEIHIDRLYVFPEFMKKQYATKLVTLVLLERKKEHEIITIKVVPDNEPIKNKSSKPPITSQVQCTLPFLWQKM